MSLGSLLRIGSPPPSSATLVPGSYVTDGDRLFRVVSQFSTVGEDVFAALEDCRTLGVETYAPGELFSMGLRAVSGAAAAPIERSR